MKKFLLSIAAVCCAAFYASADMIVDYEFYYSDVDKFPFYVMGYEPAIEGGVLKATYPGDWYQFFIADQIPTQEGETYTATVKIKASVAGTMALNMGWGWGEGQQLNSSINVGTEWKEVSATYEAVGGTKCNLVLQPGTHEGTVEIEWVKVAHGGEAVVIPETGKTISEFYTSTSDATLSGWGGSAKFENVTEDDKPCLKFTNETAAEGTWGVQMAINGEYAAGTTYYVGFDIKGTEARNIETNFQSNGSDDGTAYYEGKGSLSKFGITPEWKHVIIYGECGEGSNPAHIANCILFNLGKYVGTFYMTNVTVYTADDQGSTGIAMPVVDTPARTTVYNLQGIKVLDTDDAGAVKNLAKGIYIVNGKKVAVR